MLTGKVAVVTGASRGIGLDTVTFSSTFPSFSPAPASILEWNGPLTLSALP